MSNLATTKYIIRGKTGYVMERPKGSGISVTSNLLNALLFDQKMAAAGYANTLEGEWEAVRVSHRLSVEIMEEGYGDAVKGDLYPKHLDML